MDRGEYQKAVKAFKADLKEIPLNGWSLKGVILALNKLNGTDDEANEEHAVFENAAQLSEEIRLALDKLSGTNDEAEEGNIMFESMQSYDTLDGTMKELSEAEEMLLALSKLKGKNSKGIEIYMKEFEEAWKFADVQIDTACY